MKSRHLTRATTVFLTSCIAAILIFSTGNRIEAADGPDPIFEKPEPITLAELAQKKIEGVSAVEVSDYSPGRFKGELTPSPPHADLNPKKAVIIAWENNKNRFVFSHEASYCPFLELPSGAAMCNQFFEGNLGEAELMNNMGRKEKNSFVDVLQSGPQRVWVRWTYFAVNMKDDTQPRLRGTEDYFAYPNGLVLRRMTYESLMPNDVIGYSTDPVELFGIAPVGSTISRASNFPCHPGRLLSRIRNRNDRILLVSLWRRKHHSWVRDQCDHGHMDHCRGADCFC